MLLDEMALRAALHGDGSKVKELLANVNKLVDCCPYCDSQEIELGVGDSFRCDTCDAQWER